MKHEHRNAVQALAFWWQKLEPLRFAGMVRVALVSA